MVLADRTVALRPIGGSIDSTGSSAKSGSKLLLHTQA